MQSAISSLPSFKPLMDMLIGPVRLAVLDTFIALDIADHLKTTGDPDLLADHIKVDRDNLVYLLDAATALGLATKNNGWYTGTEISNQFLVRSRPTYLGEMLTSLAQLQHRNLHRLTQLVRTGKPELAPEKRLQDPEHWKRSAKYLANYHRAGMAGMIADIVTRLPKVDAMRRILDLGSGPGVIGLEILTRHPHMQGVFFDLPAVAEVTLEEVRAAGMETRVEVMGGDYNEVSFGQAYDLVLSSLNLYYARDLETFLKRVRQSLNPGGVFISFHEGLTHERTQPAQTILSRLSLAVEGQDVSFSQGTIPETLLRAGFALVHSRTLETDVGIFELDIAHCTEGQSKKEADA